MPVRRSVLLELSIANALASQLFDRELEHSGLRPAQAGLLTTLAFVGSATPTQLEHETGLPPTTLRERLQGLQAAGYVERRPNPDDGRSYLVEVTEEGRAFVADTEPVLAHLEARIGEALGHPLEDHRDAIEQLRRAEQVLLASTSRLADEGPETAVVFT